jgi:hypothetical protein
MLNNIFPRNAQTYSGYKVALYLFYVITAVTLVRSLIHMFFKDGGAQSIASIPLDNFTVNGAAAVISIFSIWGLSQFIIGLIYIVVCWRYKGLIPMFYLLLVFEYSMRIYLFHLKPVAHESTPPGVIGNYFMIPIAVILFFLSVYSFELRRVRPHNKGD